MRKILVIAVGFASIVAYSVPALAVSKLEREECEINGGTIGSDGKFVVCYGAGGDVVACYGGGSEECIVVGIRRKDIGKPLQPTDPKGSADGSPPVISTGKPAKQPTNKPTKAELAAQAAAAAAAQASAQQKQNYINNAQNPTGILGGGRPKHQAQ